MRGVPVVVSLQQFVERIVDQVRSLRPRIEVLRITMREYPARIGIVITETRAVRIEFRIDVTMVGAVQCRPPDRRALESQVTGHDKEIFDRFVTFETAMRQKAMIANHYA